MGLDRPGSVSFERLQAPFESASDALARLDERLRSSPVAEAFVLRAHFHDACAALWRAGEFVQIEDLISFPPRPLTAAWKSVGCPSALTDDGDRAYKSLMADWGFQRKLAASALIGAVICLVALQGIISSARSAAAFRFHASASFAAANYEICRIDPESDRGVPIDERHTTDQCCLLCGAGGRDDPPTLLSLLAVVCDFFARPTSTGVPLASVDDFDRSLEPWANSHLARAPPSLS